ncbi:hypothetical protein AB4Y63_02615 [Leifsonia sp. YAF41]|uniref:DUF7507 domain-containing protein n=1 Tax=Leifsonia sp. YAF41 TaxID=3233086 RepID=UPI003F9AA1D3
MAARHSRHSSAARRRGRTGLALLLSVLVSIGVVVPVTVAQAAGTAQLSVNIEPVDSSGNPQTTAGMVGSVSSGLGYRVSYSCNISDCTGATIVLSGTPFDPNYNFYQPIFYSNWTAPFVGATISPAAGSGPQTVALGAVAVGDGGSFVVNYDWSPRGFVSANTPAAASFLPSGFQIVMTATGNATSALAPIVATAAPVVWTSTVPTPALALIKPTAAGGTARTGDNYSYTIRMASNCLTVQESAPKGDARFTCAKGFTVTDRLPAGAEFVSASPDGAYDSATHSVIWTQTPKSGAVPAIGWHRSGSSSLWIDRTVTVKYSAAAFSPSGTDADHCDFTASVTNTVDLSMTYLGTTPGDNSNVKTASAPVTHDVTCVRPFAKGSFDTKQSTFTGPTRFDGNTVSPVVVQPDAAPSKHSWLLSVSNQSNVPGIAIISDDHLDVQGTKVTIISALAANQTAQAGASIDWTLNDGVQGTTNGPVATAPTGKWFVATVVRSAPLAGPNLLASQTGKTLFHARFDYTVLGNAPVGERRANTASARMQYPNTALADLDLGSVSHTLEFEAPFGRGKSSKDSTQTRVVGGVDHITVPATNSVNHAWNIDAYNTGNVPGVAVITDSGLGSGPAKVTSVNHWVSSGNSAVGASLRYTLNTGATGTTTIPFTAPAGTWITAVSATSPVLQPIVALQSQANATSAYQLLLNFAVPSTTPVGVNWTNTASVAMTYPNMGVADVDLGNPAHTIRFEAAAAALPAITAQFVGAPVVEGGGSAVPGRNVTYTVRAVSSDIPAGETFSPQYVFLAPQDWTAVDGSAAFAPGSVPDGASFSYRTVSVDGVNRSVVVVTWPAGVTFGANATWPSMTVEAQPGFAAAAGTTGIAAAWMGEASKNWTIADAKFASPVADAPDIDGDGNTTEGFSRANAAGIKVGSASQISVIKEICQPDAAAADGCNWVSKPDVLVSVDTAATDIDYRIRLVNTGNTSLSNLVAYDVLPHIGDTGTSGDTASVPRGSTFNETLSSVRKLNGVTLSYSTSTNPCRAEVYPGQPAGCSSSWTASVAGATAIKISAPASIAPGASVSFEYRAAIVGGAAADAVACNSVAVKATQIGTPIEPRAVCATAQEADLELTVPDRLPLQVDRPGVVPFTVVNHGGSQSVPATVKVSIPVNVRVTDLTPSGWNCVASTTLPNGSIVGPVTLTCSSVAPDGTRRALQLETPETIAIPVVPLVAQGLCVPAVVSALITDPVPANNEASGCFSVKEGTPGITLTKTDGLTAVGPGQEFTYTLTVQNMLVGEALSGATLADTLPSGVSFVSASNGGTQSGNTVTWQLGALGAAGVASGDGDGVTGGAGSGATVTVTVKSSLTGTADITNSATVTAPDPHAPLGLLSATATDTDGVRAQSVTKTSNAPAIGVTIGDTVTYTVTTKNTGSTDYTTTDPARIVDDLSSVLSEAAFVPGSAKVKIGGAAAVALSDPSAGILAWSGALAVDTTATVTYQVTITSGVTPLVNTAYTTTPSSCVNGADVSGLACAALTIPFAPVLSIVKTAQLNDSNTNGTADVGESISYSFVVTNSGGTDAKDVRVVDPKVANLTPASVMIPAGASQTFTADAYLVTLADVNTGGAVSNTAKAAGKTLAGDPIPDSAPSTASVPITTAAPSLTIQKSGELDDTNGNGAVDVDEKITYHFVVTNTGNVTLHGLSITDARVTNLRPTNVELAPGEQKVFTADDYVGTQLDVDNGGTVTNTATIAGLDPNDNPVIGVPSTTTTPLVDPLPALSIVKTASLGDTNGNGLADVGEKISYGFVVTNTGNVSQRSVSIDDAKITGIRPATATLVPGEWKTFTSDDYTVTQADIDAGADVVNTATATGTDPQGQPTVSVPSATATPVVAAVTALSLVKTAKLGDTNGNGTADAGERVSYSFVVTNTGNVTLSGATVIDPKVVNISPAPVTLAPGESQTFTADSYAVAQSDLDSGADLVNTATASGVDPSGGTLSSDPSTATTPVSPARPGLSIVKSGLLTDPNGDGKVDVGETIAYSFIVENTGNVTVHGIGVIDVKVTGLTPSDVTLAPGEQQLFTADSYVGTQADVDNGGKVTNTATVDGMDPRNVALPPTAPSTVTLPLADPKPAVSIVKTGTLNDTNGNGLADAGETIGYSFVVTNTGNVTVTDTVVNDKKVTGIAPESAARLLPGEKAAFTAEDYIVTANDVANGKVTNTATASATSPDQTQVSAKSTVVTRTGAQPIDPVKPVDPGAQPGPANPGGLGTLSETGAEVLPIALIGLLLAALGILALVVRRRRSMSTR